MALTSLTSLNSLTSTFAKVEYIYNKAYGFNFSNFFKFFNFHICES